MALMKECEDAQNAGAPQKMPQKKKKFVRYSEGAKLYSIGEALFVKLAMEAHAVYKINHICLVNTEIFEDYLESYRV